MFARTAIAALLFLAGCAAPPAPQAQEPKPDPTTEPAYAQAVDRLTALNRQAEDFWKRGLADEASAAVREAQPLQSQVLAPPHPTLAAMEAASDLDDLYARMLLTSHEVGWARMVYQKNVSRWKVWTPQSPETARRLRQAQAGIAQCDRLLK